MTIVLGYKSNNLMCKIYTQLVFIEKIPEEDQVIRQGTAPVIPIVGAGPFRILVGNFEGKHFLMQPSVAPDENIVDPAVEYYFQLCAGIFSARPSMDRSCQFLA